MLNKFPNLIAMIVALLLFSATNLISVDEQNLKLEISFSKQTFLSAERVWLDVTLINSSKDTVRVYWFIQPNQGPLQVEIEDSAGIKIPYTGSHIEVSGNSGWTIKPDKKYFASFDLLEYFNNERGILHHIWGMFPKGQYTVRASYIGLESNELKFEILEPAGEQIAHFKILEDAFHALRKENNWKLYEQKLKELVSKYPKGIYAEKALKELDRFEDLLRLCPNSGYTEWALQRLVREIKDEQRDKLLKKVISDSPHTRAAKHAEQLLILQRK